jgi:AraC-like DNA-binding protein
MDQGSRSGDSPIARGYLNEDFMLFHLKDCKGEQFAEHFHDFYKIIVFVAGTVTYLIEGRAYRLQPWDILLVTGRKIHRPVITPDQSYERYVLWVKSEFLDAQSLPDSRLLACFEKVSAQRQSLLRPVPEGVSYIKSLLYEIKTAGVRKADGDSVTQKAYFLLLLVYLNRLFRQAAVMKQTTDFQYDTTITQVIDYINQNLAADLRVVVLAERFYLSQSYLMHKFKKQTGYSLHNFILKKRLIAAHELIKQGEPYMEASSRCGIADYSSFVRAFCKYFGRSPRNYIGEKEHG